MQTHEREKRYRAKPLTPASVHREAQAENLMVQINNSKKNQIVKKLKINQWV